MSHGGEVRVSSRGDSFVHFPRRSQRTVSRRFGKVKALSLLSHLRDLKNEISRWGPGKALAREMWVGLERGLGLYFYRIQTGGRIRPPLAGDERVEMPEDVKVGIVDYELISEISQNPEYDISPGFVEFCIANGHDFWGLFVRGRLAHYMVRGRNLAPAEKGLVIRINEEFDYDYKSFTLPEFRGRGYPRKKSQVMRDGYGGAEVRPVISYISIHNYPSLRSNEKEDQTFLGYAGYWHIWGRWWFLGTRKVRTQGFRFDLPTPEERRMLDGI